MTPQLQQAIKMLQLSNIELSEFVEAEIEQNPLLDHGEAEGADAPAAAETDPAPPEANGTLLALPEALQGALQGVPQGDVGADAAEHWSAASGEEGDGSFDRGGDAQPWQTRGAGRGDGEIPAFDQTPARPRTLREHLIEQIGADLPDQVDRVIAFYLLDQVDEAGYLQGGLDGAAERLGCAPARIERVLARLQEFDPPGVFARDLAECLALQLRDRDRLDPAMQRLLDNLPLLAARNAAALMRLCGVDAEDLPEKVAEIKSLDPRPGFAFDPPLA